MPDPKVPADDHRFPCTKCGADMRFAPGQGQLICDHCGNTEPLTTARAKPGSIPETAFRRGIEDSLPDAATEERHLSHCPNCGAEVEFDPAVHAMECPFCATPVVADPGISRRIRPHGVAPFLVTVFIHRCTTHHRVFSECRSGNGQSQNGSQGTNGNRHKQVCPLPSSR